MPRPGRHRTGPRTPAEWRASPVCTYGATTAQLCTEKVDEHVENLQGKTYKRLIASGFAAMRYAAKPFVIDPPKGRRLLSRLPKTQSPRGQ
jgi:hypothetical protein